MRHGSFAQIDHRPFPLPSGRWRYSQIWSDLAFFHWPVSPRWLRKKIPLGLEIDEFEGRAWIGVVPFRLWIRRRGFPALPRIQIFPEINVRTYVSVDGRPGVWFFSLDAPSPLAIWAARRFFHLPYERSRFEVSVPPHAAARNDASMIEYQSSRVVGPAATFRGRYRPTGPVTLARPGTLDHFLTERYCLYSEDSHGTLYRGHVHHVPWPLQSMEAEIDENTMAAPLGLELDGPPEHLTFAQRIEVSTWPLERVRKAR